MTIRSPRDGRLLRVLVVLPLLAAGVAGADQKIVRIESRTFPNPMVWDSNYTACLVASDGRVYVG